MVKRSKGQKTSHSPSYITAKAAITVELFIAQLRGRKLPKLRLTGLTQSAIALYRYKRTLEKLLQRFRRILPIYLINFITQINI
jgi:hypothetical protein